MEGGQKREPEKDARIRRKRKRREIHSGMITIFLGIIQKHRQSKDGKGT